MLSSDTACLSNLLDTLVVQSEDAKPPEVEGHLCKSPEVWDIFSLSLAGFWSGS